MVLLFAWVAAAMDHYTGGMTERSRRVRGVLMYGMIGAGVALWCTGCTGSVAASKAAEESGGGAHPAFRPGPLFLEAWTITRDNFFDPAMRGVDWEGVLDRCLPRAEAARDGAELGAVINSALAELGASHTHYFTPHDRAYFELLDIFNPPPSGVPAGMHAAIAEGPVAYVGIGVVTELVGDTIVVADVYPGCPAEQAGIRVGDEIFSVENGPWSEIDAFRGREGMPTRMQVARRGEPMMLEVTPARIQPYQVFLDSIERSSRTVEYLDRSVAVIRVRSYANSDFQAKVEELLRTVYAEADALVLDLRGPWGGASPEYLSLFNPLTPSYQVRSRGGEWTRVMVAWERPVAMVVDGGTRSGKELLAHAFRKHGVGPVVGERTAGAVLGGRPFYLSDGSILYLAVQDVRIEGERLEGAGVEPTVPVKAGSGEGDEDPFIMEAIRALIPGG